MDFCGTQYYNDMMFLFLLALIFLAVLVISILEIFLRRKNKKKIAPAVISASLSALILIPVTAIIVILVLPPYPPPRYVDPMVDLTGYDYEYCKTFYAEYFDLSVSGEEYSNEYPKGTIIRHEPRAGASIIRGSSEVRCVVSKGVRQVVVCNVIALSAETAEKMLAANELEYEIKYVPSEEYEEGIVISTEPERNTEVPVGSTVTLYVSSGKE